jgi:type I site-specific restriction endonuclease
VLEYFSSATQIGMTATPKETREVSNIDYFGDPIYTYSLKQGISDIDHAERMRKALVNANADLAAGKQSVKTDTDGRARREAASEFFGARTLVTLSNRWVASGSHEL